MRLTRRRLLEGGVVAALGGLGFGIDRLVERPRSHRSAVSAPLEQHLLRKPTVVIDDGVEVLVPPLHHRLVTARLTVAERPAALREARQALERVRPELDPSATDLALTVAWGAPYFRRYVPAQARREIPVDRRATTAGREGRVLEDAERFPSDPDDTILEDNDVAVLLRSDRLADLDDAQRRIFGELTEIFAVTSIRKGFVGGGFGGEESLPKRMAMASGVRGGRLVPESAQLFLGFTSTVKRALGPPQIANCETLGYAELRSRYFVGGTHMHLSHVDENLLAWYLNFDHGERVHAMIYPGLAVAPRTQTVRQGPEDVETVEKLRHDYGRFRRIGHSGAIQSASRLDRAVVGHDGTAFAKGT